MVQKLDKDGYLVCSLSGKHFKVHRLVAKYFLKEYSDELQVNHKDGNKLNNNVLNLEMVDRRENIRHAIEHKLLIPKKHEEHWCSKLTETDVAEIRKKYIPNVYTQEMLAKEYNVSRSNIKLIVNNKT